jgi:hypothetical protein
LLVVLLPQNLKELIPQKSPTELALLLQPWTYQFKRLLLDPAKSVRAEAATIMAAVGSSVGKSLLPQLKKLLGPWYLACFDPYPDAATAAKKSLLEVFPGSKQADVLMYCRCAYRGIDLSTWCYTPIGKLQLAEIFGRGYVTLYCETSK